MTAKSVGPGARDSRLAHRVPGAAGLAVLRNPRSRSLSPSPKTPPVASGDKPIHTDKERRHAAHIEAGYEKKGLDTPTAKSRAWATVNKLSSSGAKAAANIGKPK